MLLKDKKSGELIKISDTTNLVNPVEDTIQGKVQGGQNEQPPTSFEKQALAFPSGEDLPRCWLDADYREKLPAQ